MQKTIELLGTSPEHHMDIRIECSTCLAWSHGKDDSRGRCRMNAPTAGDGRFASWPETRKGDWCLEHVSSRVSGK